MGLSFIQELRRKIGRMACNNRLYEWSLSSEPPEPLAFIPADPWPGDPEKGRWLCGGDPATAWAETGHEDWRRHLNGFSWLRDLRALGGDEARRMARDMIAGWIEAKGKWDAFAWRPDITGQRMAHWIGLYGFYGASASEEFQNDVLISLGRQGKHLARALPGSLYGLPLLYGIRGLIYAGLAMPGREQWLIQGLDLLEKETGRQILPDGGHISRSPKHLMRALKLLIDIRAALVGANYPAPEQLIHMIDRMTQAARFFRMADKGFCVFNGGQEDGAAGITESVLAKANARGKTLTALPQSGYERMTMGRTVVVVDAGAPATFPYDSCAHASPLAFEFFYGRERVLVSCGSHPLDPQWRELLRSTAAHNALTLDNRNACEIRGEYGHMGRRPRNITIDRQEADDSILLDMSHDGYVALNGITHRRRLYLSDQGHDFRGEEILTCAYGLSKSVEIALRFHLHPRIQASLIREGQEALLRLPGGAGWRFFHTGGSLALEDSLYLGRDLRPRKTQQLVISGRMDVDAVRMKWALRREGR